MMERTRLTIGTRGSALARWQAEHVASEIRKRHPEIEVSLQIIVTSGDRFQAGPVGDVGGKAVWVKEIEEALLARTVDLAVHSLKDVPGTLPQGLTLGAYPVRADPRDAWLSREGLGLLALPKGAKVGTSSLRRQCQLRALRPDLQVELLRGNVDTRLRKLGEGQVDAAVLACAGLDRLGFSQHITDRLDPQQMLPAIGQGCMAIEVRQDDPDVAAIVGALDHPETRAAVSAERALMVALGGSCRTPVGGHAQVQGQRLVLHALVGRPDGTDLLRGRHEDDVAHAVAVGQRAAEDLLARGAARILAELG